MPHWFKQAFNHLGFVASAYIILRFDSEYMFPVMLTKGVLADSFKRASNN